MMDRCETFTDCRTTIPLSFLKVSHLNTIPCGFYESPNEQNQICELCTFSQIRSHIPSSSHISRVPQQLCSRKNGKFSGHRVESLLGSLVLSSVHSTTIITNALINQTGSYYVITKFCLI